MHTYNPRESLSRSPTSVVMLGIYAKPKIEGRGGWRGGFSKPKPPAFKGPTPGLDQVVLNYGVGKGA